MMKRLASYDDDIDFPRIWRIAIALSLVAILVAVGSMATRGLNLGIDFEGGTSWEVEAPGVSVSEARDAAGSAGEANAKIQVVGGDTLRVQGEPTDEDKIAQVTEALAELAGTDVDEVSVSTVGPTWGDEISSKAQRALVYFFIVIALYIAVRLEWKMAAGALLAVVHDILITVGVYSIFQFEVTPATVIAILTILGYSLYDTIVVYDKVKENMDRPAVAQKHTYTGLMSLSLNQVLMRSLNTTITSLLPVLAMLIVGSVLLGAVTLQEFAIALAVGLVVGAYSSIFVSAPSVAWLKEREPQNRNLRKRLEKSQGKRSDVPMTAEPATVGARTGPEGETNGSRQRSRREPTAAPEVSDRIIPPRPRKKGKRR